ncbi:hypothetical protein I547_6329 [Mycobacterium kansasii 824]|nr:hypothetical protein I547_6329 [Mycobacterium kansasii 824]
MHAPWNRLPVAHDAPKTHLQAPVTILKCQVQHRALSNGHCAQRHPSRGNGES